MTSLKVMHIQGQFRKVECSEVSKVIHMYTYLYVCKYFRKRKIFTCLPCATKDFSLMCRTMFIENQVIRVTFLQLGHMRKLHFLSPNPSQGVRNCRSCTAVLPLVSHSRTVASGVPNTYPSVCLW